MYPYHRLLKMILGNLFRKQRRSSILTKNITFNSDLASVTSMFILKLTMADTSCSAILHDTISLFESACSGTFEKNKYAFVIGGSTMRYRKRLAPFRKATVRSKIVGFDKKFYYFQQTIEQKEKSNLQR